MRVKFSLSVLVVHVAVPTAISHTGIMVLSRVGTVTLIGSLCAVI